jgi:arylsulfatase A-like enzyme
MNAFFSAFSKSKSTYLLLPLLGTSLVLLGLVPVSQPVDPPTKTAAPNIIFILADDLGYGDLGFNGQTHIKTPNLDAMAQAGMVFENHYAGSPVCGPSRSCLLTGTHTGHTRVRGNPGWTSSGKPVVLLDEDVTVAEELKRAGYRTGIFGKWGMDESGTSAQANGQGFDEFFGYRKHREAHNFYPKFLWHNDQKVDYPNNNTQETTGKYSHDEIARQGLDFIRTAAKGSAPFFAYLSFTLPHYELTVPADSKAPYENLGWPKRPMEKAHYRHDPDGNVAYAGMVSRLDGTVGQVRALLRELNIDKNTLVIFTSDNGAEYDDGFFDSNGPFRGMKRDVYEGGVHVPFVAAWPGTIRAGSRTKHVSAFWDFLPTACDLAGLKPTHAGDGISYRNALLGRKQAAHNYLYWEFNEGRKGPKQAIRQGDWKLVTFLGGPTELYNLASDIGEERDLAAKHPDKVKAFLALLATARTADPNYELVKLTPPATKPD